MVAVHTAAVFSKPAVVGRRASSFLRPFVVRSFVARSFVARSFAARSNERPKSQDENLAQRAEAQLREAGREACSSGRDLAGGAKDEARTTAKVAAGSAEKLSDKIQSTVKDASRKTDGLLNMAAGIFEQKGERVQDRARQAASDVQKKARDLAGKAGQQMKELAGQAQSSAHRTNQSAENAADKTDNYAKRVAVSLNESIDAAEDKFAASFSPNAGSPQNRRPGSPVSAEVLHAAQAREEANINDLIDELEDKVRDLDHIKDAVKRDVDVPREDRQKESSAC